MVPIIVIDSRLFCLKLNNSPTSLILKNCYYCYCYRFIVTYFCPVIRLVDDYFFDVTYFLCYGSNCVVISVVKVYCYYFVVVLLIVYRYRTLCLINYIFIWKGTGRPTIFIQGWGLYPSNFFALQAEQRMQMSSFVFLRMYDGYIFPFKNVF